MLIDLITHSLYEDREKFQNTTLTNRRDAIFMVVSGSFSIQFDADKKTHIYKENDIVFVPAGTTYTRNIISTMTFYLFSFTSEAEHPFRLSAPTGALDIPREQRDAIFHSTKRAFLIPDNQIIIAHIIEHIFAEQYIFSGGSRVGRRAHSEQVLSTISYMNRNLDKDIDIDELSARVYLSHTGLLWKFKQELNTTPSQYLILLRLRYAKQLLLEHDYTVTEVAERCGYSNPYYFTNAFHRYTGMSPTAFRQKHLGR